MFFVFLLVFCCCFVVVLLLFCCCLCGWVFFGGCWVGVEQTQVMTVRRTHARAHTHQQHKKIRLLTLSRLGVWKVGERPAVPLALRVERVDVVPPFPLPLFRRVERQVVGQRLAQQALEAAGDELDARVDGALGCFCCFGCFLGSV